ncbi:unnamed protein product [Prorocentrum cordatum]|uniref:Uncharacterized protein n=1 Tax=Prorocentrum cordatum TaxID=2364126 RepID=A0ABN9RM82_9DINO|nr:unnamed protein product [Polarella glacialis]
MNKMRTKLAGRIGQLANIIRRSLTNSRMNMDATAQFSQKYLSSAESIKMGDTGPSVEEAAPPVVPKDAQIVADPLQAQQHVAVYAEGTVQQQTKGRKPHLHTTGHVHADADHQDRHLHLDMWEVQRDPRHHHRHHYRRACRPRHFQPYAAAP